MTKTLLDILFEKIKMLEKEFIDEEVNLAELDLNDDKYIEVQKKLYFIRDQFESQVVDFIEEYTADNVLVI